jgi:hypothetical protein
MHRYGLAKTFPTAHRSVHRMARERASWSTVLMGERAEKQVLTAVAGVGALFLLGVAIAAPQSRPVQPRAQSQIQPSGQHLALGQHLDLRAPAPAADVSEKTAAFPSGSH